MKQQTPVQKKTLNPNWNYTCDLKIPSQPQPNDLVTIDVYDYDSIGDHDFLGSAHCELSGLMQGQEKVFTAPIMSKKGTCTIALTAVNFSCPVGDSMATNTAKQTAAENSVKKDLKKGMKTLGKMF